MGLDLGLNLAPGLLGGGAAASASEQLYTYLATLGTWTLDVRFNEASGPAVNYGSDGNTGTVSGATQAQTGQLGEQEAYFFDGATTANDAVSFANASVPNTKALTTQRWMVLLKVGSSGENGVGQIVTYGSVETIDFRFAASLSVSLRIITSATAANAITNANAISANTWTLLFGDYDDAGSRKCRLWKSTAYGVVSSLALATDTAATGTINTPAGDLFIGNRQNLDRTVDGYLDLLNGGAGLWTTTVMENISRIVFPT